MPQQPQVRRSALTSRAAVLALVVCTLVLMLAYPVQQYLAQRTVIGKLHRANATTQQQVDALAAQDALWKDPAYVARQARSRLHYVMPGETEYVLTGGVAASPTPGPVAIPTASPAGGWYATVWGTVQQADHPPAPKAQTAPLAAPHLTRSPAPVHP